jgi:hypothetical protein
MWFEMHYGMSSLSNQTSHPSGGGYDPSWYHNLTWSKNLHYGLVGAATCPVDVRGCELFERAQAFFYDREYAYAKEIWTGLTSAGSGHYRGRVDGTAAEWTLMLKNGVSPSLDLSGGYWLNRNIYQNLYGNLPATAGNQFHSWGETAYRTHYMYSSAEKILVPAAVAGTDEAEYAQHFLFNRFGQYTSGNLNSNNKIWPIALMYVDPDATQTDYTAALAHQYLFSQTDRDTVDQGYRYAVSKTGWATTDTSITMDFRGSWEDHAYYPSVGTYQIFNGEYLYGDNRGSSLGATLESACCVDYNAESSLVEVGDASSSTATEYYMRSLGQYDPFRTPPRQGAYFEVKRWAGTNPTGRSDSKYTYLSYEAAGALDANYVGATVTQQLYHYLHLKNGDRNYLLRYVDTAVSASKRMRSFLQYPNTGDSGEGNTTSDANGLIYTTTNAGTSMHSKVLYPATLSQSDLTARRSSSTILTLNARASETYPVRYLNGGVSCSFTAAGTVTISAGSGLAYLWLKPSDCTLHAGHNGLTLSSSGVTVDSGITAFPGSDAYPIMTWNASSATWNSWGYIKGALPNAGLDGNNNRRYVVELGTGTSGEELVFHDIHSDQVTGAATAALTTTTDWQTVQVDEGDGDAVAAFSRGGECKDSWGFTSDHVGTADYVIAGVCSGTYDNKLGGVDQGNITVSEGDETAYWSGESGVWTLVAQVGTPPLQVTTTSLLGGTVGVAYSDTAVATGGVGSYAWTVTAGALPDGLSLAEATGIISGTPTVAGLFEFTIQVEDEDTPAATDTAALSITIAEAPPAGASLSISGASALSGGGNW